MVKICTLSDYIELVLPLVEKRPQLEYLITCLIIEMQGLYNPDNITRLLIDHGFFNVIQNVIDLLSEGQDRQEFIAFSFTNAFARSQFSFAICLLLDFQPSLIYQSSLIIQLILPVINASPYQMEIKLDILYVFIPHIIYRYVDVIIDCFHQIVTKCNEPEGIFANNINPVMVAA